MKKNKKQRTFKYISEEPIVQYRALDKNGNIFIEGCNLEDVLEEASRLDKVTFEKMEVFEVTVYRKYTKPKPTMTNNEYDNYPQD